MTFALNYTTLSDRGLVRQNNEDSAYAGPRLLALADGMGGHAAGEIASQLMIAAVSKLDADQPGADLLDALAMACAEGNASIAEEIEANPKTQGMGTTLTALLFDGARVGLCHVGDSRGYLLRDGELIRITRDDTYVQSLVDEGQITAEEASVHPQRSLILKALTGRPVEPSLQYREIREGDRYLLCSDGLSDPVSQETIAETLGNGSPQDAAARLVELALRSGGPDNVTVVVADVVDHSHDTPTQPSLAGALTNSEDELPRPDTAAGRAAAFRPRAEQAIAVTSEPATAPPKSRSRILVAAVVLLLVAGVAGLGVWGWQKKESMYHLAVDEGTVQVMHGVPGSLLGISLSNHHQYICLSDTNEITMPDPATPKSEITCHLLEANDLVPAARSQIESLPADSYDGIRDQIGRLSKQALPVCLTVKTEKSNGTSGASVDTKGNLTAGSVPGQNCREVTSK